MLHTYIGDQGGLDTFLITGRVKFQVITSSFLQVTLQRSTGRILIVQISAGTRTERCFLQKVFEEVPKSQVTSLQGAKH